MLPETMNLAGPALQARGRPCGPDRFVPQPELAALSAADKAVVAAAFLRILAAELPAPHEAFEEALELVGAGIDAHCRQLADVFDAQLRVRGEMIESDPNAYREWVARLWPSEVSGTDLEFEAGAPPPPQPDAAPPDGVPSPAA